MKIKFNTDTILISKQDLDLFNSKGWFINKIGKTKYLVATSWDKKTKKQGTFYFHREILKPKNGYSVDHIDGNGLNNSRGNLRICSHKNNIRHRVTVNKNNKLGVSGVHIGKNKFKKYVAKIKIDYKNISLGAYRTIEEARFAYEKGKEKYHGKYA